MKNIFLLFFSFFLFSFFTSVKAQTIINKKESFSVVSNNSSQTDDFFLEALSNASMESYRLRNKDVKISFNEGAEFVLLSATKLVDKGEDLDLNQYKINFTQNYTLPFFSISSNGSLLAGHRAKMKF